MNEGSEIGRKKIFAHRLKYVYPTPKKSKGSFQDWYDFFYGTKKSKMAYEFARLHRYMSFYYPYLSKDQINGRCYDFLNIPNVMGKINKTKFTRMMKAEKALQNRLEKIRMFKKPANVRMNTPVMEDQIFLRNENSMSSVNDVMISMPVMEHEMLSRNEDSMSSGNDFDTGIGSESSSMSRFIKSPRIAQGVKNLRIGSFPTNNKQVRFDDVVGHQSPHDFESEDDLNNNIASISALQRKEKEKRFREIEITRLRIRDNGCDYSELQFGSMKYGSFPSSPPHTHQNETPSVSPDFTIKNRFIIEGSFQDSNNQIIPEKITIEDDASEGCPSEHLFRNFLKNSNNEPVIKEEIPLLRVLPKLGLELAQFSPIENLAGEIGTLQIRSQSSNLEHSFDEENEEIDTEMALNAEDMEESQNLWIRNPQPTNDLTHVCKIPMDGLKNTWIKKSPDSDMLPISEQEEPSSAGGMDELENSWPQNPPWTVTNFHGFPIKKEKELFSEGTEESQNRWLNKSPSTDSCMPEILRQTDPSNAGYIGESQTLCIDLDRGEMLGPKDTPSAAYIDESQNSWMDTRQTFGQEELSNEELENSWEQNPPSTIKNLQCLPIKIKKEPLISGDMEESHIRWIEKSPSTESDMREILGQTDPSNDGYIDESQTLCIDRGETSGPKDPPGAAYIDKSQNPWMDSNMHQKFGQEEPSNASNIGESRTSKSERALRRLLEVANADLNDSSLQNSPSTVENLEPSFRRPKTKMFPISEYLQNRWVQKSPSTDSRQQTASNAGNIGEAQTSGIERAYRRLEELSNDRLKNSSVQNQPPTVKNLQSFPLKIRVKKGLSSFEDMEESPTDMGEILGPKDPPSPPHESRNPWRDSEMDRMQEELSNTELNTSWVQNPSSTVKKVQSFPKKGLSGAKEHIEEMPSTSSDMPEALLQYLGLSIVRDVPETIQKDPPSAGDMDVSQNSWIENPFSNADDENMVIDESAGDSDNDSVNTSSSRSIVSSIITLPGLYYPKD